ncbi:McrB family protein [Natrialbaceae archaeon A-arb3/5]
MSERSPEELVAAYLEDREWDARRAPVVKTSRIVREVASAVLDAGSVGTQELTALYRLCMNNDTYPVSSKRGEIDELDISEDVKQSAKDQIDEKVGTVGGLLFPVEVPESEECAVTACFETLVTSEDREELDEAVRRLAALNLPKVECGKISPILYYLHPECYPVVNNMSRSGMAEYFDVDISNSLAEYPEIAAQYRSIRGEYRFQDNFRDLDYFFVWMNRQERKGETSLPSTDRTYFWVNQGNHAEIRDEYVRAKVDDVWHHDLDRVEPGDVIFHNFDDELIGVSVVAQWREQYSFKNEVYQRVGVELRWFDDPVTVDDELKASLDDPRFRQKYYPIDSNGHLKQAYLSELSPAAAELLLDHTEGWNHLQQLDSKQETETKIPEKPDRADKIARQLEDEMQTVFYGPPGTGKTYTAERFAKWWAGQQETSIPVSDRVETVTFHPSFTYEDFIEGLSAEAADDGQVAYEVQDGILKQLSETATEAYEEAEAAGTDAPRFVLIIDEINRGNLAQIFGETITLLEGDKRGSTIVRLAHSGSEFTLPPNLYVIGTMNTADRSIALVDTALRRRFRFISCPPAFDEVVNEYELPEDPLQDGTEFESLLGLSIVALQEMNDRIITSADLGKGKQIGHTRLFGVETVTELRDVWRFDILPLLEEYYFGQFDRIQQELFDGEGDDLFDWERKQIREFTASDLFDTLSTFADDDVEVTFTESTSNSSSSASRKQWDRELFFDDVESSFEDDVVDVYRDFFEFGATEADEVDYGTGKRTGSVQFYWDEYNDGDYLIYEIRTDGTLQFRFWSPHKYDESLFEAFLERVNPLVDEPIDVEFLLSDDFTQLQIPIERLRDNENSERVKNAIREFVENCDAAAP